MAAVARAILPTTCALLLSLPLLPPLSLLLLPLTCPSSAAARSTARSVDGYTRASDRRARDASPAILCACSSGTDGGRGDRPAMSRKDIVFVTGNANKLEEVRQIFQNFYKGSPVPFNLTNKNVDLPEHQGERDEICRLKAHAAFKMINGPCIVEDTSLCFNAMGGLPGPYVKWFLKATGPSGLYCMLKGFEDKTAMAVCTVAYVNAKGHVSIFSGKTDGEIVEPKVSEAFGWDSCFKPDGYDVTYGEMPKEKKNLISHRLKAFFQLKEFLDKEIEN